MTTGRRAARGPFAAAEAALRAHALAKPEATEHFPWGERAIKVKGKVFLFMYADASHLSLSTKLPVSSGIALMLPFAEPTGYGLGKAGWVSARFEAGDQPPTEMLTAWIDESYQAIAPARLAALTRGDAAAPAPPPARSAKRPAARSARGSTTKPGRTANARSAAAKPGRAAKARGAAAKPGRTAKAGAAAAKPGQR